MFVYMHFPDTYASHVSLMSSACLTQTICMILDEGVQRLGGYMCWDSLKDISTNF